MLKRWSFAVCCGSGKKHGIHCDKGIAEEMFEGLAERFALNHGVGGIVVDWSIRVIVMESSAEEGGEGLSDGVIS